MAQKEYYLILPLLLYGLAVADLVNSWRSFFQRERRYVPYIITSLLLLELAFWNFFKMYDWMTVDSFRNYFVYSQFLLTPMVFLLVVAVFTPDAEIIDIREYFERNIPIIYGGLAVFVALHFFYEPHINVAVRLAGIALLVATAWFRKTWLIYLVLVFRVVSWLFA
jgi:hypothetical protein